eukprot:Colp12_sorted_trinity150504_noHs@26647
MKEDVVIPGRLTEGEWQTLVENEDGEAFIQDLVEEIYDISQKVIYQRYIESQVMPYTIERAKETLLYIIEWQFLPRDDPNIPNLETWRPDLEPDPAVTDSWARGAVPKQRPMAPEHKKLEFGGSESKLKKKTNDSQRGLNQSTNFEIVTKKSQASLTGGASTLLREEVKAPKPVNFDLSPPKAEADKDVERVEIKVLESGSPVDTTTRTVAPPKAPARKGGVRVVRRNTGVETRKTDGREKEREREREKAREKESERERERDKEKEKLPYTVVEGAGSAEISMGGDYAHDHAGNLVAVFKLDPDKGRQTRVKPKVNIVSMNEAPEDSAKTRRAGKSGTRGHGKRGPGEGPVHGGGSEHTYYLEEKGRSYIPSLTDYIRVAPGVVLKEGDLLKKGPAPQPSAELREVLRTAGALKPIAPLPPLAPRDHTLSSTT